MPDESPRAQSDQYIVVGRNTAIVHSGSIHDDERAHEFGFKGGLVPGVNVLSHMCHPMLDQWGEKWLEEGSLDIRLRKPVYHGQKIEISGRFDANSKPESCEVEAVCGTQTCASGRGLERESGPPNVLSISDFEDSLMPERGSSPFIDQSELFVGMPLGSIKNVYTRQEGLDFMERMGEEHPPFTLGDYAHPGVLLSYVIYAFVWSFTTPIGIHAGCYAHFHKLLKAGMKYETRGRISKTYQIGSSDFVDYDCLVLSGRDIIMSSRQQAVVGMDKNKSTE